VVEKRLVRARSFYRLQRCNETSDISGTRSENGVVDARPSNPDKVETSIGTLEFFDGAPSPETAGKAYDCIDTMRGADSFLKGVPLTSMGSVPDCRLLE
jgi:hypothetical protein